MSNNYFLLEKQDLETAQEVCAAIDDNDNRNTAVAGYIAANIASKYFNEFDNINTDVDSGLHNIPEIISKFDISDIYLNGNYVDVRLYFNSNSICVPASHFETGLLPVAYMFIKLGEDLSEAEVEGFITPENIDKSNENSGYYKVNEDDLVSFYDIEPLISYTDEAELSEDFEKAVIDYPAENNMGNTELIKILLSSETARRFFADAANAKHVLKSIEWQNSDNAPSGEENNDIELEYTDTDISLEPVISDSFENLTEAEETEDFSLGEFADDSDALLIQDNDTLNEQEFSDNFNEESSDNSVLEEFETINDTDEQDNILSDDDIQFPAQEDDDIQEISLVNENEDVVLNNTAEEEIVSADDFAEISEYDYSTEVTENIDMAESNETEDKNDLADFTELAEDNTDNYNNDSIEDNLMQEAELPEASNEATIDNLFSDENNDVSQQNEDIQPVQKKKKSMLLPVLGIAAILAAGGYYAYTQYMQSTQVPTQAYPMPPVKNETKPQNNEAMPVETVENTVKTEQTNEGTPVSIPEIEKNLGGSVDVSALSVSWEVPSTFVSNATAKRYFVKLGKVLQLNLKTELLLQSTPPISNKITLELEFNNNTNNFEIKNIIMSSGTSNIDEVIKGVVQDVLKMNLNTNMSVFGNLKGNPVLIIKL